MYLGNLVNLVMIRRATTRQTDKGDLNLSLDKDTDFIALYKELTKISKLLQNGNEGGKGW
jgi:hypothetical protein